MTRSEKAQANIDAVNAIFTQAIDNDAPIAFFKYSSELRINGTIPQEAQAQLVARTALAYYFEKLTEGANYRQIAEFRERALALKNDAINTIERIKSENMHFESADTTTCSNNTKENLIAKELAYITQVDNLIFALSQLNIITPAKTLEGWHHALTASYKLFGDINQAYNIIQWSGGVSGANMENVVYY